MSYLNEQKTQVSRLLDQEPLDDVDDIGVHNGDPPNSISTSLSRFLVCMESVFSLRIFANCTVVVKAPPSSK